MQQGISKFSHSPVTWLILGVALRLLNLTAPVVDAGLPRQTQTLDAIRGMIAEPGFQLDAPATWRGTPDARVVQELPLYNWSVEAVYHLVWTIRGLLGEVHSDYTDVDRPTLDASARLVSALFWGVFFLAVQPIWKQFLQPGERTAANFLLVFAPLSLFFGQATMPEALMLACATGFVVSLLAYERDASPDAFLWMFLCALLASLVKFPAFSHLGLLAVIWLWHTRGFRFLLRWPHWAALVLLALALRGWAHYITSVNTAFFAEWTSEASLRGFLGRPEQRISPKLYLGVAAYNFLFILGPTGALAALAGLLKLLKERTSPRAVFFGAWLLSLIVYVLAWGGQTAGAHNYYNLPMLVPLAASFGIGLKAAHDWLKSRSAVWMRKTAPLLQPAGLTASLLFYLPVYWYFFHKDTQLLEAAEWIRNNTRPDEIVGVKLNHSAYYVDYIHVPAVSYYSGRICFMAGRTMPEDVIREGLEPVTRLIETRPISRKDALALAQIAARLKGANRPGDDMEKIRRCGFEPAGEVRPGIVLWERRGVEGGG